MAAFFFAGTAVNSGTKYQRAIFLSIAVSAGTARGRRTRRVDRAYQSSLLDGATEVFRCCPTAALHALIAIISCNTQNESFLNSRTASE